MNREDVWTFIVCIVLWLGGMALGLGFIVKYLFLA